jgi:nucleoside-diphosphate-sugar epimerase
MVQLLILTTLSLSMALLCNGLLTPPLAAVGAIGSTSIQSVLVIGGTGRVGRAMVPRLIKEGFNVRVLCRDLVKAKDVEELVGAELVLGDVCNMESLVSATVECNTVIDVHGMKPIRLAKITDLFTHPKNIPYHPYNINYLGVKRILVAMEINKVKKIVRITGAFIDTSAFIPLRALFNLLLSFTSKWHEASELAIRQSGLDYTVIRPTEIVNKTSLFGSTNRSFSLLPGEILGLEREGERERERMKV